MVEQGGLVQGALSLEEALQTLCECARSVRPCCESLATCAPSEGDCDSWRAVRGSSKPRRSSLSLSLSGNSRRRALDKASQSRLLCFGFKKKRVSLPEPRAYRRLFSKKNLDLKKNVLGVCRLAQALRTRAPDATANAVLCKCADLVTALRREVPGVFLKENARIQVEWKNRDSGAFEKSTRKKNTKPQIFFKAHTGDSRRRLPALEKRPHIPERERERDLDENSGARSRPRSAAPCGSRSAASTTWTRPFRIPLRARLGRRPLVIRAFSRSYFGCGD